MLSTQYRLRLEFICKCIANGEEVKLDDMIWAEKLSKANTSAREMLKKARRAAANPDIQEGSMDDFMNKMGLGDPDPSNHKTGFDGADEIVDWFQRDKPDDWRQRVTNRNLPVNRITLETYEKMNEEFMKKRSCLMDYLYDHSRTNPYQLKK